MKIYITAIIMSVLLLIGCFASFTQAQGLTVITDEWPPYEFKVGEEGNDYITGFSTEVITAVLKTTGVGIKGRIEQYPWARVEHMILVGQADLMFTAANNAEREKNTYYCYEPIISSSWSYFVRAEDKDKFKIEKLEDLGKQKIGVVRAYSYTKEFWEYVRKNNTADEVPSDDFNIKKLIGKRFNIILMDSLNGLWLSKQMGVQDKIVMLPTPLAQTNLYCVFSKATIDKDSVGGFETALKEFKKTREYQVLWMKYFK